MDLRGKVFLVCTLTIAFFVYGYGCTRTPSNCEWRFSKGWHAENGTDSGWIRWSGGKGEIKITVPPHMKNGEFQFKGEVISIHAENNIDVFVNDQKIKIVTLKRDKFEFKPLETILLPLKGGDNLIVFASQKEAVKTPADPRPLAIAFKNLELSSGGGVCELKKD